MAFFFFLRHIPWMCLDHSRTSLCDAEISQHSVFFSYEKEIMIFLSLVKDLESHQYAHPSSLSSIIVKKNWSLGYFYEKKALRLLSTLLIIWSQMEKNLKTVQMIFPLMSVKWSAPQCMHLIRWQWPVHSMIPLRCVRSVCVERGGFELTHCSPATIICWPIYQNGLQFCERPIYGPWIGWSPASSS